jgi:hypothetical protein
MPLDQADWDKMAELLDAKLKPFADTVAQLQSDVSHAGKRISRLEAGYDRLASAARRRITDSARRDHDRLLRGTFDAAHLLALPPLIEDDPLRKFSRHPAKCMTTDVKRAIQDTVGKDDFDFDVELAKPAGFRIIFKSRSPQVRRQAAASILKHCKTALEDLELFVQYDKPYELRKIQRSAHKFLGVVKKLGGPAVTSTAVKQGFLIVNGFRLAPECLVPSVGRWDHLAGLVKAKVRFMKSTAYQPEDGAMYDVFGNEYAADKGVFSLEDMPLEDEEGGGAEDGYNAMQH